MTIGRQVNLWNKYVLQFSSVNLAFVTTPRLDLFHFGITKFGMSAVWFYQREHTVMCGDIIMWQLSPHTRWKHIIAALSSCNFVVFCFYLFVCFQRLFWCFIFFCLVKHLRLPSLSQPVGYEKLPPSHSPILPSYSPSFPPTPTPIIFFGRML